MASKISLICAGSCTGTETGWEWLRLSWYNAGTNVSTMNWSIWRYHTLKGWHRITPQSATCRLKHCQVGCTQTMCQDGSLKSVPMYSTKLAKPSFSHRSSHHFMVTRLPNHYPWRNRHKQLHCNITVWPNSSCQDSDLLQKARTIILDQTHDWSHCHLQIAAQAVRIMYTWQALSDSMPYLMSQFMSNYHSHPLLVGGRRLFLVKQYCMKAVSDQTPVLHGTGSKVWDGDHVCTMTSCTG